MGLVRRRYPRIALRQAKAAPLLAGTQVFDAQTCRATLGIPHSLVELPLS